MFRRRHRPGHRHSNASGASQSDGFTTTSDRASVSIERTSSTSPPSRSESCIDPSPDHLHAELQAPFSQHAFPQPPPPTPTTHFGTGQAICPTSEPYQWYYGTDSSEASTDDSYGLGEDLACSMNVSPGSDGSPASPPPSKQRRGMAKEATRSAKAKPTPGKKRSRRQEQHAALPWELDERNSYSTQDTMLGAYQIDNHASYLNFIDPPEHQATYSYARFLDEADLYDRDDQEYREEWDDNDWDMCGY